MQYEDIAQVLGVTGSRISKVVSSRIKPAVESAYLLTEAFDLYRDGPDASRLVVDWIKL